MGALPHCPWLGLLVGIRIRALQKAHLLLGHCIAEGGKRTYQGFPPGIWRLSLLQKEGPSKSKDPSLNFGCGLPSSKAVTTNYVFTQPHPAAPTQRHIHRTWEDWKITIPSGVLLLVQLHFSAIFFLQDFCSGQDTVWDLKYAEMFGGGKDVANPGASHSSRGPEESLGVNSLWPDVLGPNVSATNLEYHW